MSGRKPRALIISQVYVPDHAAVGQQLASAAAELVRRGCAVDVLTADAGYHDPSEKFARREIRDGVAIFREPFTSFGKSSLPIRLAGALSFTLQSTVRALLARKPDVVIVSTAPPMVSAVGTLVSHLRSVPLVYWVMDVNPDEIIAMGQMSASHPAVHALSLLKTATLREAAAVVVLDDFMGERMLAKGANAERLTVIPPWPLENYAKPVPHADNPFRKTHRLNGRKVFMFSGNMSHASPLTTFLEAAARLRERNDIVFMFIGGGSGKAEIETRKAQDGLGNVISLPYQPLEELQFSLSAADVHLVTLGDPMVGIIHPCKVYGAMAVARPVLYMGPKPSHISALIDTHQIGWHVSHGDVAGTVSAIERIATLPERELQSIGERARAVVNSDFSMNRLCGQFCDVVIGAARGSTG